MAPMPMPMPTWTQNTIIAFAGVALVAFGNAVFKIIVGLSGYILSTCGGLAFAGIFLLAGMFGEEFTSEAGTPIPTALGRTLFGVLGFIALAMTLAVAAHYW